MGRRRSSLRIGSNMGMTLLALWLILTGLSIFVPQVRQLGQLMPLLALGAGLMLLMNR